SGSGTGTSWSGPPGPHATLTPVFRSAYAPLTERSRPRGTFGARDGGTSMTRAGALDERLSFPLRRTSFPHGRTVDPALVVGPADVSRRVTAPRARRHRAGR